MQKIIFFDGVCPLCNRFVTIVFNQNKKRQFKFASLQSASAAKMLHQQDLKLDTIVYTEDGRTYYKSAAVLRIMYHLGGAFRAISVITTLLPNRFLDFIYSNVARNRYKLFGQSGTCRLPSAEEKAYFLV